MTKKKESPEIKQLRESLQRGLDKVIPQLEESSGAMIKEAVSYLEESNKATILNVLKPLEKLLAAKVQEASGLIDRVRGELDNLVYSEGFYDGRKHIVSKAEEILVKQLGLTPREELAGSGKIPEFWIATLVLCLADPPNVRNLVKSKAVSL